MFVGLQEAGEDTENRAALDAMGPTWLDFRPDIRSGQSHVPVTWESSRGLRLVREFSRKLLGPGSLKDGGPGGNEQKWLNGGLFDHIESRQRMVLANTHLIAGSNRAGEKYERRRERFREQVGKIAEWATSQTGLVFVTGDMNAPPSDRDLRPLREAGLVCCWDFVPHVPTHDTIRTPIDHVWFRPMPEVLQLVGVDVDPRRSDHKQVTARFRVAVK
jgi:hypothetical protein